MAPIPSAQKTSREDLAYRLESLPSCHMDSIPCSEDKPQPQLIKKSKQDYPKEAAERTSKHIDQTEDEKKLWSTGCGAAMATTFLYIYGNILVMDQMPVDKRVESWIFVASPTPIFVASLAYITAVTWIGPRLMRDRQPFISLKPIMILYNAFQVVFSAWVFHEAGMGGWFGSYNLLCQPCDFSDSPQAIRMVHAAFWYNISKFIDFIDTMFFILNKKYDHISLLHVCHHALMPLGVWYGMRHEPGGQTTFFGFLNCFVHVVMYSYYLLAAMGPRVRPYLWWKKYLTTLQMVQFIMMFVHAALTLATGCPVGHPLMRVILALAFIFLILFLDFYIKAYRHKVQGSMTCIPKLSSVYEKKKTQFHNQMMNSVGNSKTTDFNYSFSYQKSVAESDDQHVNKSLHID